MQYKRAEPFRFALQTPVPGHFTIASLNGISGKSKKGEIEVLDISPNGLKFKSSLELPANENIELLVTFQLNHTALSLPGTIVWRRLYFGKWLYGFSVTGTSDSKEQIKKEIIKELKQFIRNQN
ncbi:PilZ domain-containing protein [Peribacillus deserti]|uniref:PilZ domain-containing protein n=1 Tax=Peribacillus deserti TaxID=673318 RepID=A0A2N5M3J4_9BACI|nr:PilZ domain-containing protein [Peribacillus deserti]PLT28936.1 hypothetical protein CUU66_15710 [Peribacillus deserti]